MDTIIIASLCLMLISFTLSRSFFSLDKRTKSQKLPPGPTPLPIIGNIHKLGNQPHISLAMLAQTYGPIMHLKLGRISTIVISSSLTAQHVLQKQDLAFSSRPPQDASHACNHAQDSVIWLPMGSRWRSLRKIVTTKLFSTNRLESNQHLRSKKVQELVEYCGKCSHRGEAVDIGSAAFITTLNLLSNTIFSKDMTDPFGDSAKDFRDLVWNIMLEVGKPNLVDFFPVLRKFDPQGIRRRMTRHVQKLMKIFDDLINERLELKNDQNINVLDELIKISHENPDELNKITMEHMFIDLFVAGTDTTSSTVEWGMAELLRNPEAVAKAKAELNQVIGKGKMIEEADISHLPYLRCIVKETLRLHPSVPFLVPRRVEQEVELCGYTIPKASQVFVNTWAIGRDPMLWNNPLLFQPERFMESEVDVKGQDFGLIPFGAGRRICPGLPLAMRMVPVMLASLINCYDWELEGGITAKELDMEEKFGITLAKLHPLRAMATPVV